MCRIKPRTLLYQCRLGLGVRVIPHLRALSAAHAAALVKRQVAGVAQAGAILVTGLDAPAFAMNSLIAVRSADAAIINAAMLAGHGAVGAQQSGAAEVLSFSQHRALSTWRGQFRRLAEQYP